jgi:hypothetical protein
MPAGSGEPVRTATILHDRPERSSIPRKYANLQLREERAGVRSRSSLPSPLPPPPTAPRRSRRVAPLPQLHQKTSLATMQWMYMQKLSLSSHCRQVVAELRRIAPGPGGDVCDMFFHADFGVNHRHALAATPDVPRPPCYNRQRKPSTSLGDHHGVQSVRGEELGTAHAEGHQGEEQDAGARADHGGADRARGQGAPGG